MLTRRLVSLTALVLMTALAATTSAVQPALDSVIPAAARGAGSGGSLWVTALYLNNLGDETATVRLAWLDRDSRKTQTTVTLPALAAGAGMVFDDVISTLFAMDAAGGALRITSDEPVAVSAAILNRGGGSEYGQGFDAVPVADATVAGNTTIVPGVRHNADFRSNVLLVDTTGIGSTATVEVVDISGKVLGVKSYTLGAWQPVLESLDRLGGPDLTNGALRVTVTAGAVVAGASRINRSSGDPITLSATLPAVVGWAPAAAEGHRYVFSGVDPSGDPIEGDVVFETGSSGVFIDADGVKPFTYRSYQALGNIALLYVDLPSLDILDMQLIMLWSNEGSGYFTGVGESEHGPMAIGGNFTEETKR